MPTAQVLNLVKKQVSRFACLGQCIEPFRGDTPLKPIRNTQDGFRQPRQSCKIVKLHAQNTSRLYTFIQQILDNLKLCRSLANLTRASNNDNRRDVGSQTAANLHHQMPSRHWLHRHGRVLPPRVEMAQIGAKINWETRIGEKPRLLTHNCHS